MSCTHWSAKTQYYSVTLRRHNCRPSLHPLLRELVPLQFLARIVAGSRSRGSFLSVSSFGSAVKSGSWSVGQPVGPVGIMQSYMQRVSGLFQNAKDMVVSNSSELSTAGTSVRSSLTSLLVSVPVCGSCECIHARTF